MENQKHDVSFVVAIYNPDLSKLSDTLESIIKQKGIDSEIVICDDASNIDYSIFFSDFFLKYMFSNYSYIRQKENVGTVKNVLAGVMACNSDYVKLLSPGDYIYSEDVIRNWLNYIENKNADWSFGEAVYYRTENAHKTVFRGTAYPLDIKPYLDGNIKKCQWNCCVLKDLILGANTLCKNSILIKYLGEIDGKIKFAEDNIYRIMIFDGNVGIYYPEKTIYYEYGEGISTVNNVYWDNALHEDFINSNNIMKSHALDKESWKNHMLNSFDRWYFRDGIARLVNLFLLKGGIKMFFCRKYRPRKTQL